jgi:ubiquitin carboxyl-terminal hydrolase 34
MKQWTTVLLDHNTEEASTLQRDLENHSLANRSQFVGREPADNVVIGLCSLLEWCLELATTANVTLESLYVLFPSD